MKIYGIFGFPLRHTLSPAMHEAAFKKTGIDAAYLPLELDPPHFMRVVRDLPHLLLSGFNVTVPYKKTVMPYLDGVSREAALIGAVNTVERRGRRFYGSNTDWTGFSRALAGAGFRVRGKRAVLLGAGGAARACVYALLKDGIREIAVFNRHSAKAAKIKREFRKSFPKARMTVHALDLKVLKRELASADLLVNTTSVGLKKGEPALVPARVLPGRGLFVYDLIYNPPQTPLLRAAKRKRLRTLNGLTMLLYQGTRAFEIWTGRRAPEKIMRRALEQGVKEKING